MATQEEIELICATLRQIHPAPVFKTLNETQVGIGAVIRLLDASRQTVTAGGIAECMGVSTARVAVLLKKMSAKGLIVRENLSTDGRVTVIRLSEAGKQTAIAMEKEVHTRLAQIIDHVGMNRMQEFLATLREITTLTQEFPDSRMSL